MDAATLLAQLLQILPQVDANSEVVIENRSDITDEGGEMQRFKIKEMAVSVGSNLIIELEEAY